MLTRQPRVGERIRWAHWPAGRFVVVRSLDGNLCWTSEDGRASEPFIWRFRDGLNTLAEVVEDCLGHEVHTSV